MKIKLLLLSFFLISATAWTQNSTYSVNSQKMNQLLKHINDQYLDTVNFDVLVEKGVIEMLKDLDPHSSYISKKEVQQANEPLIGSFDGIGVTFQIIKDTINIMEVIVNGPSEKVGLMAGDKIIRVDTAIAHGKHINNKWVQDHLRGKKGTKVTVAVKRGKNPELLEFTITRDKIPMNSINVYFMADKNTGYIRLERFAQTSIQEFRDALTRLKARGMKNLIFDLRGNGGGYLQAAFEIADEFLGPDKMIVYTDNFRKTGESFMSTKKGDFQKGRLIILVDEGSASASEIVSGAVQDWDRGLVIGRRTFGKGLVQKPIYLADGSQVRLTISKYYTPSGRFIQRPYNDGLDSYLNDLRYRSAHGELLTADSIKFPDSLKYQTAKGRTVFGGGGIMPDIFIPIDTSRNYSLYNEMFRKGIISGFVLDYMDANRERLKLRYATMEDFKNNFEISDQLVQELMAYARSEGIKDTVGFLFSRRAEQFLKDKATELDSIYNSLENLQNSTQFQEMLTEFVTKSFNESVRLRNMSKANDIIKDALRYEIARNLFSYGEARQIFLMTDDGFLKALEVINNDKIFRKFNVEY
ncbi:MAG: S41 family peptidase [Bacteroidetes bacterium]|nr:S41 family peptidase [Bacteroidota bacterium]MCL2303531.1 S41 family peptidase [Lentimicrobiaceae bacterium]